MPFTKKNSKISTPENVFPRTAVALDVPGWKS